MSALRHEAKDLGNVSCEVLEDIGRRTQAIDNGYRAAAEQVGQLYIHADQAGLEGVTELLDGPMRSAADNQRAFAALLDEVQAERNQRRKA